MSDRIYVSPESDEVLVVPGGVEVISVGTQGPPGAGGASGGTTGQYLRKASNTDFDTLWDTLDAADLPSHTHSASDIIAGQLGLVRGGTGADLSATGGTGHVVMQESVAGVFTVRALLSSDIPDLAASKITSGEFNVARIPNLTLSKITDAGTMASQNANNVAITGGAASGLTSLGVTGNTTLGDASGDTLTINGTAVTIPNGLNFDSNTLVIDAANNRIGFNVAAPGNLLDARLDQNATTAIRLMNNNTSASARLAFIWNNGTSDLATMQYNLNSPNLFITTSGAVPLYLGTNNTIQFSILSTGFTGVGTSVALTRFQVVHSDSGTNNTVNTIRYDRNSSGSVAAGFTQRTAYMLQNAGGTTGRFAAGIDVGWNVATALSEVPDMTLYAVYANGTVREGMRIRGGSSGTQLGFFGVTPVARQALGAWGSMTDTQKLDALRDAMTNLGLTSFT